MRLKGIEVSSMKQLIITIGLIILGLGIFGMMITDDNSLFKSVVKVLQYEKEAYLCTT